MKKYLIKSFCKINLSLRVLKKLNNGYHNISSLITFCDLHDVISICKTNKSNDKITFSGKFKKGINKKSNTITKLLFILRKKNFFREQYFNINVQKNIPHGSGLGGGSSNAANLLNFFNLKMNLRLDNNKIDKIANQVGFDVVVNLKKKNAFFTGTKEKLLRIKKRFGLNILIVYPNIICSTKKIYEKNKTFTSLRTRSSFYIENKKKLITLLKNDNNDLEKTVVKLYPKVGRIVDLISIQNGCYFSRITGSGSACIGIFSDMKSANYTKKLIKQKFPKYWSVTSKTI